MSKIPYVSKTRIKKAQDDFIAELKKDPKALKEYQNELKEIERIDKEYNAKPKPIAGGGRQ
ncbi:MAG: hypothetical protein ACTSSK_10395 [Candidatus Heimdallarchaeota archaeon]